MTNRRSRWYPLHKAGATGFAIGEDGTTGFAIGEDGTTGFARGEASATRFAKGEGGGTSFAKAMAPASRGRWNRMLLVTATSNWPQRILCAGAIAELWPTSFQSFWFQSIWIQVGKVGDVILR